MSRLFNGSSSYLSTPTIGNLGNNARTVAFWVRTASPTTRQFIYYEGSESTFGRFAVEVGSTASKFSLNMYSASFDTTTTVLADTWYHIAAVADPGGVCRLFVNGTQEATSGANTAATGSNDINIGRFPSGAFYLNGQVAELAKWSFNLATEAIAALSHGIAPLRIFRQNLQYYFPLRGAFLRDLRGGATLADTSTSIGDHPRIIG